MPENRSVIYTSSEFTVNGQRDILLACTLDFRGIPAERRADVLARLRRDGLNAVQFAVSPVAYADDGADVLAGFLDECGRQGLYAVAALGAGDRGSGTGDRGGDALAAFLAERQWTNGGPVVLVTVGDGDPARHPEGTRRDALTRAGVTVPILAGLPEADSEYAMWRVWATGGAGYVIPSSTPGTRAGTGGAQHPTPNAPAARRVSLWARTFAEILRTGKHRGDVPARGGFRVSETATRERGGIVFVENPDPEKTVTGSVFPYLPEITLGPQQIFAWVHDTPLGPSDRYLAAYAGLVKSDARILTAHIRPDPFEGVRLYVYGEPGETREVVLFHGADRGQGVDVTFADTPQVYPIGPSQVIALSTDHAGRTFFCPEDDRAPVLIGPDDVTGHTMIAATVTLPPGGTDTVWSLDMEGNLTEILADTLTPPSARPDFDDSAWEEIELPVRGPVAGDTGGWYRTTVFLDEETDATLRFGPSSVGSLALWVNGEPSGAASGPEPSFDLRLRAGENQFAVHADNALAGPVTLIPSGGCYLLDVSRWRRGGKAEEPETVSIAL